MIRRWLRRSLRDFWEGGPPSVAGRAAATLLSPAELSFRAAAAARNAWYSRRPATSNAIPAISVGNLTVGGTGKTPVVRWLAEWLGVAGLRVAIAVRGYGADEVALYRRWFGREAVFVGRDRAASVAAASVRGYHAALVDDGFQHRRLGREVDVLLVAAEDPWPVRMLPRGPYREPLAAAARATCVLVTRKTAPRGRAEVWRERLARVAPAVPGAEARLCMGGWSDLDGAEAEPPEGDVLAVSSVARPGAFLAGLGDLLPGARAEPASFADHHEYSPRDVASLLGRLGKRTIVCTEKDAVKLAAYPEMAPHCVVVGFGVAGEPRGALRRALERIAGCASR